MAQSDSTSSEEELIHSIIALPKRFQTLALEAMARSPKGTRQLGSAVERIVNDVLTLEGVHLRPKESMFEMERNGKKVKRITPDVCLDGNRFIEITKWGDSNKLCSILANAYIVKRMRPGAKYYAVVASYRSGECGWTTDAEVDFFLRQCGTLFPFPPVDGVYGFGNIDELVAELKGTGKPPLPRE